MPPTIDDISRRTIANLTVPRSVPSLSHELRIDPHTRTRADKDVHEHLQDLEAQGWVVNLGTHTDTAHLAHLVEGHKTAHTMPDDKAAIWARRRASRQAWEVQGDVWMMTDAGLDKLREPVVEDKAFTTEQMIDLISTQQRAVTEDPDKAIPETDRMWWNPHSGQSVPLPVLHPDEFDNWLGQVLPGHERVWGKAAHAELRKKLPISGGAGWTDVWENMILDHENQKTSLATADAITTPWFMPLSIVAYTDADTGATHGDATHLPTYTGYAAIGVPAANMAAAAAGSAANNTAIQYAACTAGTSAIVAFGNNSVVGNTTGIFRKWGTCTSTTISTTQTPAQFAIGAYTTTAD